VTLTNTQTGVASKQTTDAAGRYDFANVLPGSYRLSGELTGFIPEVRNIQAGASNQFRVDLVLRIGGSGTIRPSIEGTRLVWTAAPGTGNSYVIERSGPGLTLFTPVAGPISETSYFIDTAGNDFAKGATYNYRVRAIDSAGNKGEPSNPVSVRSIRIADLPLVGTNVLDLLAVLPGAENKGVALSPADTLNRSLVPTIRGTVLDSSKAKLPGVQITLTRLDTTDSKKTVTNEIGEYSFKTSPGQYELKAELSGFETFTTGLITLKDGETIQLEIRIKVKSYQDSPGVGVSVP
jgi:hypothetical protein